MFRFGKVFCLSGAIPHASFGNVLVMFYRVRLELLLVKCGAISEEEKNGELFFWVMLAG